MRIKYWLVLSYLLVMLLPLLALFILYKNITHYDEKQNIREYIEFQNTVSELETVLNDPGLYQVQAEERYRHLEQYTSDQLKVVLYRDDGVILHSTLEQMGQSSMMSVDREILYKNLNEMQKTHRTYTIKQPVFKRGELVGIYEIVASRHDWVETTERRGLWMLIAFVGFFILLYVGVIWQLHRKLNRPMRILQRHMTAFAQNKQISEPLPQSKDEVGELIHHFDEMRTQIEDTRKALYKEQADKEFMVAALSHDLKTPLTVIRTYAEALNEHEMLDEQTEKEYRHILFEKLDHMKEMIDDLAIYTALQSSQNPLNIVSVHGEEFFEMVFAGFDELCEQNEVDLVTEQRVQRAYRLDPKQMIRVIDNLVENAIRHTNENGKVGIATISSRNALPDWVFEEVREEVETYREKNTAIIVQNSGDAIPKEKLKQVFEPFYQVDTARGSGATSGLGLSIAKMLIEQHGGDIRAWSIPHKGTMIVCLIKERGAV